MGRTWYLAAGNCSKYLFIRSNGYRDEGVEPVEPVEPAQTPNTGKHLPIGPWERTDRRTRDILSPLRPGSRRTRVPGYRGTAVPGSDKIE